MPKICYNCWLKPTTKDHCPPRFIYSRPFPKNIKTVPSCKECNNSMAANEAILFGYFCALMWKENYIKFSLRGIKSNKPLTKDIVSNFIPGTNNIQIKKEKIHGVLVKIIKGIYYLKFGCPYPGTDFNINLTQNNLWQNDKVVNVYKNLSRTIVQSWVFDYGDELTEDWKGIIILNFFDEIYIIAEAI